MDWIPLKDAIKEHHLSEATIWRRIAKLKNLDPVLYLKIVRKTKGTKHNAHECLKREFFAFLNTDIRVFKKANAASVEQKENKHKDDHDPSMMRMLITLLRVNDYHEIELNLKDMIKAVLNSDDSFRFQASVKICYLYSFTEETLESACKSIGIHRRTFKVWRRSIPIVPLLFGNCQMMRKEDDKMERREAADKGLRKMLEGYDKILPLKKYRIQLLRDGTEVYIAYEMHEHAKHVPPSVNAISLELFNNSDGEYKRFTPFEEMNKTTEKPENEFAHLSDEELSAKHKQLKEYNDGFDAEAS